MGLPAAVTAGARPTYQARIDTSDEGLAPTLRERWHTGVGWSVHLWTGGEVDLHALAVEGAQRLKRRQIPVNAELELEMIRELKDM